MPLPSLLRPLAVLALGAAALTAPGPASADQLIQIPTADLVTAPKAEYKHRIDGKDEGYDTLFVPVGLTYELMARYYNNYDRQHRIEGGGQFQLLPDGYVTPGIAVGVWDITNSSPWERRFFLVLSKSLQQGQFGIVPKPFKRVQVTAGTGSGRFTGLFAGLRADLPLNLSLVAEYDARRLNAGIWWNPVRPVTLKAELQNGNPFIGGDLSLKF